jgi:phosphatidylethanolamine/phosphatidyl-N-methylethanolamine N-methyltransferase
MSTQSILNAYRRYAGFYDTLFGTVFAEGRRLAIERGTRTPGLRVLEVGVGTGLSLPVYRDDCEVWGIDISEPMLQCARNRVQRLGLENVKGLVVMNAEAMDFPDHSFDSVMVMYVASVVADPARMLREVSRICKPGGDIMVVNHFSSTNWLLRAFERALAPLSGIIGFHPNYALDDMLTQCRLDLVSLSAVNWFGYWRLVHFRNQPTSALPAATAAEHGFRQQARLEPDPESA